MVDKTTDGRKEKGEDKPLVAELHIYRNSSRDGNRPCLSKKGFEAAVEFGRHTGIFLMQDMFLPTHIFNSDQPRSMSTALGFFSGYSEHLQTPLRSHLPVLGLGASDSIDPIHAQPHYQALRGARRTPLQSFVEAHRSLVVPYGEIAERTAQEMLEVVANDSEKSLYDLPVQGVGFFHSPFVELLVWRLLGQHESGMKVYGELEGVALGMSEDRKVRIIKDLPHFTTRK